MRRVAAQGQRREVGDEGNHTFPLSHDWLPLLIGVVRELVLAGLPFSSPISDCCLRSRAQSLARTPSSYVSR
jgi:hypothetical protein